MIGKGFLQSHALFGGLSDEEIEHVQSYLKPVSLAAGDMVVVEGCTHGRLCFICTGRVEILKRLPTGEVAKLAELKQGDAFGEMEFIDVQPAVASVRAVEATELLTLTNRDLYQVSKWNLRTFTMLILNMAREISRRLRKMDELAATALYQNQHS